MIRNKERNAQLTSAVEHTLKTYLGRTATKQEVEQCFDSLVLDNAETSSLVSQIESFATKIKASQRQE
jgi:hypothetical protein